MSEDFLTGLTVDVSGIERRAREEFGALDYAGFNWNPQPGSWSVGQCLEHLVISNEPYFGIYERVATGAKPTTIWERLPLLPTLFGAAVLRTVHPDNVRKSKAPRVFQPTTGTVPLEIRETFYRQQQRFIEAFESLRGIDLDATIVTSPVARFIPYSLRHALLIPTAHEERHLQQAERVLRAMRV